jgi:hypothetical protein
VTAQLLEEPISILRGLDPAVVQAEHSDVPLVYLIHLDKPFRMGSFTFRHYIGYARAGNLAARMIAHRTGSKGSKFLRAARRAGCTWHLARVWEGDIRRERQIKNQGGASRFCPSCGIIPREVRQSYRGPGGRYISPKED